MAQNKELTLMLPNRIDASNADKVSQELRDAIAANGNEAGITLDAGKLEYISSAGLRVLLGLRKQYGSVSVTEVSRDVFEIFETTGFDQILNVKKRRRVVSVEGCEVIGKGACGTVYRLDPETIIKVYHDPAEATLDEIENEKRMAQLALVGGIPTAISYDVVKVGDSYGSVFELLNAETFNDLVIKHPENFDAIMRQYVDFLKLVNSTEIDDPLLPPSKNKFYGYLEALRETLGESLYDTLKKLIDGLKDCHNVVHGDAQMKNIMLVNGEPMLIDMDTLSAGSAIFDLQAIFVTYIAYAEDEPENPMNFLGISYEMAQRIWERTIDLYFEDGFPGGKEAVVQKILVLAYARFLHQIVTSSSADTPLGKLRVKHSLEKLAELTKVVDDLNF